MQPLLFANPPCIDQNGVFMDTSHFEQFSRLTSSAAKSIAKLKSAQMEAFSLSGTHTNCLVPAA